MTNQLKDKLQTVKRRKIGRELLLLAIEDRTKDFRHNEGTLEDLQKAVKMLGHYEEWDIRIYEEFLFNHYDGLYGLYEYDNMGYFLDDHQMFPEADLRQFFGTIKKNLEEGK